MKPKIKQLVWSEHKPPSNLCSYDHCNTDGFFAYQIEWKGWKKYDAYVLYCNDEYVGSFLFIDDAKKYAQNDLENKILPYIENV